VASDYQPDPGRVAEVYGLQNIVNATHRARVEALAEFERLFGPIPPRPPLPWWRRLYWRWTHVTRRPRRWIAYRIYRFYEDEGW
jgi:hypothetical protein